MNLTMMQVGGALLWTLFAMLPVFFMRIATSLENDGTAEAAGWVVLCCMFGVGAQIFFGVACYVAGGVR